MSETRIPYLAAKQFFIVNWKGQMFVFKRIFNLLRDDERREGVKVAVALFFTTLLDFVSLASLLPVLYWLLKGGENSRAALFFSL